MTDEPSPILETRSDAEPEYRTFTKNEVETLIRENRWTRDYRTLINPQYIFVGRYQGCPVFINRSNPNMFIQQGTDQYGSGRRKSVHKRSRRKSGRKSFRRQSRRARRF